MKTELLYLTLVSVLTGLIWVPYVLDRAARWGLSDTVGYPPAPKPQDPVAEIIARDTTYWYNIAPFTVQVKLGPKEGSRDVSGGARLSELDAARNLYQATYDNLQPGVMPITAKATTWSAAGARAVRMRSGIAGCLRLSLTA